ncbi:MAG: branched-chain amino acid ABC transporter permease [Oscillospiraceae bacterium]|nr:branched-chain amino acid ABC transporter permease [Oscillospiraceae bacterium]
MQTFITTLVNGLNLGSVYALVALGYTMVYGIAKMLNFAHGDVIMVGAYTILVGLTQMGLPLPIVLLLCVVICAALGFTVEKLAYKPLRESTPLAVLITAIGVSYLLQNLALLIFGSQRRFLSEFIVLGDVKIGNISIAGVSILIWVVTIIIMVGLNLFINKTKMGSAMLAVSEDKGAAELMGVNVNRTISVTFIIGSALAGIAAILYAAKYRTLDPYTGSVFGIKAFAAAVFGGIGSIPGAMIGGLLIGIIETMTVSYLPEGLAPASDGVAYAIIIIMLILKPAGILGKKRIEKV